MGDAEPDAEALAKAAAAKAKGTEAYKKQDFAEAVTCYTEAIGFNPIDHTVYSNRSAAYGEQKLFEEALADAQECVKLSPDWAKGYARRGYAEFHLGRLEEARQSYLEGLRKEPDSEPLKDGVRMVQQKIAKESSAATSRTRAATGGWGLKAYLKKLVNPLGLGTAGAVVYAVVTISAIMLLVVMRMNRIQSPNQQQEL